MPINIHGKQIMKANSFYISGYGVFYTVILNNDLLQIIQNKNKYGDIFNLITYTLKVKNPFSLQHAPFSL